MSIAEASTGQQDHRKRHDRDGVMVGGADGANEGSIRFHQRHGFVETARMPELGYKLGRWLDLELFQRVIGDPGDER